MTLFGRHSSRRALIGGCGFLFVTGAYAQNADWQMGQQHLSVSGYAAPALRQSAVGLAGLASADFLRAIGGVDLEAVAVAGSLGPIHLAYDPAAADGSRLIVTLGGTTLHPALPDWELKPVALLADSPYTADVSLFGDGPDTDHFVYPRFHPALKDTLLGLRLLQADLMLTHPDAYRETPRFDGRVVLGAGETLPADAPGAAAADKLEAVLGTSTYQSWVLTDIGEPAGLAVGGNGMTSALDPYYYFWTTPIGAVAVRLVRLDEQEGAAPAAERGGIARQIDAMARQFSVLERQTALAAHPTPMPEFTARIRADQTLVEALNPLAWHAVQQTSRYAALFRAAKAADPAGWRAFLASLDTVAVTPAVRTPTRWVREE